MGGRKRAELETRKSQVENLTGKGKHKVTVGNHPHTNIILKPAAMRRGEYKCRKWELHLKLRDQQHKTTLYIYRLLYRNLLRPANQKTTIDTHTQKKKQPKHNTKDSHQTTIENRRKEEDQQKQIQNKQENGNRNIHINNDLKCKWIQCSNQKA